MTDLQRKSTRRLMSCLDCDEPTTHYLLDGHNFRCIDCGAVRHRYHEEQQRVASVIGGTTVAALFRMPPWMRARILTAAEESKAGRHLEAWSLIKSFA